MATEMLLDIADKLQGGRRLDYQDGLTLYNSHNILQLGRLAEKITLARQGRSVYYCLNRHINYSNICRIGCRFCGFSRPLGHPEAYLLTSEQITDLARQAHRSGATEVHIVGGVHPEQGLDYYYQMIGDIRRACPTLHIKAFTAVEILELSRKSRLSVEQTLVRLIEVGLDSLPGGGAEILDEQYFAEVCPAKPHPQQWLEVHAVAHQMGLMTNATMLYGYDETPAQRINHLLRLRSLQDRSRKTAKGRFQCFVPLPYVKPTDRGQSKPVDIDVLTDLKTIAISRLMLDNFDHIKAFWPMLGLQLAQIALSFGADDLDGTVQHYRIVDKNSYNETDTLNENQLRRLITQAGRTAVKRDPFYRAIAEHENPNSFYLPGAQK